MKQILVFLITIFAFCGWSMPVGWLYPSLIPGYYSTTNQTLTSSQSGQILILTGVSNDTQITLPTATVGLDFTVISNVAKYFAMIPQSTDTIAFSTNTAGQGLKNSGTAAVGDNIELICLVAGTWSVRAMRGTWSQGT